METMGWATAIISGIGGLVWIISHALDQVPPICRKAKVAVHSVQELRDEIRKARELEGDNESLLMNRRDECSNPTREHDNTATN